MTLVCVRLDESYSTLRLTALADTRASVPRPDRSRKTISDTTVKLFAVPVRCYTPDCLKPVTSAWCNPYFETLIGLGFSGSCFEGLTIVAHITQSLGALLAPDGGKPVPIGEGLVNLIAELTKGYFAKHSQDGNPIVQIVVFGFSDERPWVGKISWDTKSELNQEFDWATAKTLVCVGEPGLFEQYAQKLRTKIQNHKAQLNRRTGAAATKDNEAYLPELESARHDVADKKVVEEAMLKNIETKFVEGIGGVLQRLELSLDGHDVFAGFTRDDRPYLDGSSTTVAGDAVLTPVPIVEKMGRTMRKVQ